MEKSWNFVSPAKWEPWSVHTNGQRLQSQCMEVPGLGTPVSQG